MVDLKKRDDENIEKYVWRIGQYKDSELIDMDWNQLADIINKEIGNEDMPYSESAFRKPYQYAKRYYESGVFDKINNDLYLSELKENIRELEKEKVKMRDERNEYKRLLREQARRESYREQIVRAISESDIQALEYDVNKKFSTIIPGGNDLIVTLTDLHTGIVVDNQFNKFDNDVLKERMNKYLDKVFEVQARHGSENVCVIVSEIISGLIHSPIRIEANQDVIDQFLVAVGYISDFLAELSYKFDSVNVFVTPGNHSRVVANKNDALSHENFDNLIIPFLEAKLQNFDNVYCNKNEIEHSIAMFTVRGFNVAAAHGDKDDPKSVVQKFTMMFGIKPDIIMLGHRHTNAMQTVCNTKVITSGALSGADQYCMDKRLYNRPEQAIVVIGDDAVECMYDVKF